MRNLRMLSLITQSILLDSESRSYFIQLLALFTKKIILQFIKLQYQFHNFNLLIIYF